MNTYLTIITTVLVVTQIIRITQNAISLHRQEKEIKKNLNWFSENDVTKEDFLMQRKAYRLIINYLEDQAYTQNVGSLIEDWDKEDES